MTATIVGASPMRSTLTKRCPALVGAATIVLALDAMATDVVERKAMEQMLVDLLDVTIESALTEQHVSSLIQVALRVVVNNSCFYPSNTLNNTTAWSVSFPLTQTARFSLSSLALPPPRYCS